MPPANRRREAGVGGRGGFRLGYRPELDGLRGVAVLAVMAYHCGLRRFVPGGFLGVDLFFVLSGFLITALLLREQQDCRIDLPRFYLRRALRLAPALFVMLTVCCVWAALRTKPDRAVVIYQAATLTACQAANWAACASVPMDILGHAWSLSLEEQFYLAWPLLLVLLLRFGASRRRIAGLVGAGIAASALLRAALWLGPWPAGALAAATTLFGRADSLLAGCLVGLLASAGRLPRSLGSRRQLQIAAAFSALFLVLLGTLAKNGSAFLSLGGYTIVAAAAAAVIAALVNAPPGLASRLLSAPPLLWTGRISYGLYLWHFPLLSLVPKLLHGLIPATHRLAALDAPIAYALAFAAAVASYWIVERPFLRWKDRLGKRPACLLISVHSGRRSGPKTLAASSGRAARPA